jgi:hypothetical protein
MSEVLFNSDRKVSHENGDISIFPKNKAFGTNSSPRSMGQKEGIRRA